MLSGPDIFVHLDSPDGVPDNGRSPRNRDDNNQQRGVAKQSRGDVDVKMFGNARKRTADNGRSTVRLSAGQRFNDDCTTR